MKSTGIIRKIDELGRIVIPKEIRNKLGIDIKDPVEIYVDGQVVLIRKYEDTCIFCGKSSNLCTFKGKKVCNDCISSIDSESEPEKNNNIL